MVGEVTLLCGRLLLKVKAFQFLMTNFHAHIELDISAVMNARFEALTAAVESPVSPKANALYEFANSPVVKPPPSLLSVDLFYRKVLTEPFLF